MARIESELEQARQRLLEQLLAEEGVDAPALVIGPRDPAAPIPVTFAQEVLWLLDRGTPGLAAYNTPLARRVRGPLDVDALARSVGWLSARHEALRTVFEARGDGAVQVVLPAIPVHIALHDVSGLPVGERASAAIAALRAVADTPFDLATERGFRVALARIADDDHILLLLTHHIVSDAWSYGVMLRDLGALYGVARQNAQPQLPPPALQLGDYAAWQRAAANEGAIEAGVSYWRARLAGISTLDLPTDHARPAAQGFAGARRSVTLPPELHAGVRALAQRTGVTSYMVLLAAFATVLRRYALQDEITIGSAVAGRTSHELEGIVGYFSQALPMRVRFDGDPTFAGVLERVRETVLGAFEHQDTPLESLVLELQRGRAQSHAPLFRVVLTMQDLQGSELRLEQATITPIELDQTSTKFDLTLLATERPEGGGLELALWYRTDLFTSGYSERFLGHLRSVLEFVVADPQQRIAALPLLTEGERAQLVAWNATAIDEGATTTFVELFEAQAARVPDRTAVVAATSANDATELEHCSYAALNAQANQLAHELRRLGVGPNVPVGLRLDRSAGAIVGLVGILKAGGCYVPLSEDAPAARIAQQIAECGAKVVVTTAALAATLPHSVTALRLDNEQDAATLREHPMSNPVGVATADALAYVLYTSGSTGVPKGVAITRANMVHYARAVSRVLADVPASQPGDGFTALDGLHFGMVSTLSADLGKTCLLPALLSGGTLHVLGKDATTDPVRFADYMRDHALDVIKVTPNHLMALTMGKQGSDLAHVLPRRWVVLGGEALRLETARALLGAGTCRVLNHYGPTETTVGVCTFEATTTALDEAGALGAQTVPIGHPLANTRVFVVDTNGAEQPVGVPGELLLGGDGVARGYLGRADLTAERFVQFGRDCVYRTGDRVRRLANGAIEFLGRADDQVKVRGFRVELGEIAQALRSHPGVETAEVVLRRANDDMQVVAYVVPKPAGYAVSHADRPTIERLREWAAAQLPDYMVPSAFVLLEQMPLTPNGKVDRNALPMPDAGQAEAAQVVAPRNEIEAQLCAIWREVLKKDVVGVTDNFLALGGHSLLAIRVLGKISKTVGVRLPLRTLFETPTVEALAVAIATARASRGGDDGVP